jgi:hypothetical protein
MREIVQPRRVTRVGAGTISTTLKGHLFRRIERVFHLNWYRRCDLIEAFR